MGQDDTIEFLARLDLNRSLNREGFAGHIRERGAGVGIAYFHLVPADGVDGLPCFSGRSLAAGGIKSYWI